MSRSRVWNVAAAALGASVLFGTARAGSATPHEATASPSVSDSSEVVSAVERFHAALASGDSATALGLLSEDVVILESGGSESLKEYRSHHLPADIAFARAVPSTRTIVSVRVHGDAAWVSGTSITQGEFRGRPINSAGAELIVLTRASGTWKISAVHWSSRNRRAPGS